MCDKPKHFNCVNHDNACCLNETCDWHGPYMLDGPGWWIDQDHDGGEAHCPKCGHGKYIDPTLRFDALLHAAQLALEGR